MAQIFKQALPPATLFWFFATGLTSGCGIGLVIANSPSQLELRIETQATLLRKNDCVAASIGLVDAAGNSAEGPGTFVTLDASEGLAVHSTLSGCQRYTASSVINSVTLQSETTVFLRPDVEAPLTLTAAAPGFAESSPTLKLSVDFSTFNEGNTGFSDGIVSTYTRTLALDNSGRLLIAGNFTKYNGTSVGFLARLSEEGALDTTLATVGAGCNERIYELKLQSDGNILIGGAFTDCNGTSFTGVARFRGTGNLDSTFSLTGTGLDGSVGAIAIQTDGKILVGGDFTVYDGTSRAGLARLNPNGSLDTAFTLTGTGFDNYVYSVVVQSDGKILVGGDFSGYNGGPIPSLVRLNGDGTLDATFSPSSTGLDGGVRSIFLEGSGRVLVGGYFNFFDGVPRNFVVRLLSNGNLDTSFAPTGVGLDNLALDIEVLDDGKILMAGEFSNYNGTVAPGYIRLLSDGTLDSSFGVSGTGPDLTAGPIAVSADNKIYSAGFFSVFSGVGPSAVARLTYSGARD